MRVETDCHTLVIGCGNLLRADDGVGPVLIRHMWERGLPQGDPLSPLVFKSILFV